MSGVSIVIPCYNLGQFLPETIESVLAQTAPPREVIVVDDGSTDPTTLEVLRKLPPLGVTVYRTENGGAPAARNYGVERAAGPLVLCLDADDVLQPAYLAETTAVLEANSELGLVTTHVELFGDFCGLWRTLDYDPVALLKENCIASASLFRKACWEQVGGYRNLPAFQDWDYWISLVERGWKWAVVPQPLYRYRVRPHSISAYGLANRAELIADLIEHHADFYARHYAEILVQSDRDLTDARRQLKAASHENAVHLKRLEGLHTLLARHRAARNGEPWNDPEPTDTAAAAAERLAELHQLAERKQLLSEARELIENHTAPNSTVLVVSRGDDELLTLTERTGRHFPQGEDGEYAGYYPADSRAAIDHVEQLRAAGADYLAFPKSALWWLEHYAELSDFLESECELVVQNEAGALFSLNTRLELPQNTFSVVICTYKRAAFVGKAIESVYAQNYPKDKFEVIVIDNDSPDDTREVVEPYLQQPPVPTRYFVEKQNGLSYARNLGVQAAKFEYVVHLDDDATAVPHWLASFNDVINRRHALVVGGRVEKAFEPGFEPPDWFRFQYLQGFFGLNYREWGKGEGELRIRYPLYLGGGNSAYHKKLYHHFGGYDHRLGRDGKTLLAGEETYLNMVMDRNDIPMFYSDAASIDHFIESYRVTKQHIWSKARWGGVTNAILYTMFFGVQETRRKTRDNVAEIRKLRSQVEANPHDVQNFSRRCRIRYNEALLKKFAAIRVDRLLGKKLYRPKPLRWNPQDWLDDLQGLPDGFDKDRQLHHFYRAMGQVAEARQAFTRLAPYLQRVQRAAPSATSPLPPPAPLAHTPYERQCVRICQLIDATLPAESRVLMVSKGDPNLLRMKTCRGEHFPQALDGGYAGFYPADSEQAIRLVEEACGGAPTYVAFPAPAAWWLEHYDSFKHYLDSQGSVVAHDEDCLIYALGVTGEVQPVNEPTEATAEEPRWSLA